MRFILDRITGRTTLEPVRYQPEGLAAFAIPGARRMSLAEMQAAKRACAHR